MKPEIKIFSSVEELNEYAAAEFVRLAEESIEEHGQFSVALSGGSTPKKLYELLATKELEWSKIFFFFGDERNVSSDSPESNFKMASDSLFSRIKIQESNVYRWEIESAVPEKIAENYALKLENFFEDSPKFDLILLGMGADGHTASLFPHTKALRETEKTATENWVDKLDTWRYTLTAPTINNARNIMFLIAGEDKAEALKEVLGKGDYYRFPARLVKPENGNLQFLIDDKAARLLES